MKRLILYLLTALIAGAMLFGWGYRRGADSVGIRSEVRIDTVFYERPQSYGFSEQLVTVNVPRLLFAPADTVVRVVEAVNGTDSVQMEVPVRTLEYRDSTYYARVSGPVIGDLAPRLDWIETYNRTVTRTTPARSRFAVTVGAGVGYTPQGFQPTVGVQAGIVLWAK
ncbi:DUF6808 domain-containing protein [uncultured Parabacteroides sp.]|jgi:hypothetical protein|uniref:DUF6808 domain-containing protein n=1 Tax=uncultured Parabacteroides sp. TaxID=512312 RepID=UPI002637157C|nr:hypothetical protein [uncultured Parabacteroides sp.]